MNLPLSLHPGGHTGHIHQLLVTAPLHERPNRVGKARRHSIVQRGIPELILVVGPAAEPEQQPENEPIASLTTYMHRRLTRRGGVQYGAVTGPPQKQVHQIWMVEKDGEVDGLPPSAVLAASIDVKVPQPPSENCRSVMGGEMDRRLARIVPEVKSRVPEAWVVGVGFVIVEPVEDFDAVDGGGLVEDAPAVVDVDQTDCGAEVDSLTSAALLNCCTELFDTAKLDVLKDGNRIVVTDVDAVPVHGLYVDVLKQAGVG